MKVNNDQPQLISEGCVVACSATSILAFLVFKIGEFKLVLSDWLKVLYTHVQSRFYVFLMICKRSVGYLPFSQCYRTDICWHTFVAVLYFRQARPSLVFLLTFSGEDKFP